MHDTVVGRLLRALRRRRGWRQRDLAAIADLSQSQVSMLERGHLEASTLALLRRTFAALDARIELVPSWRGADLERLLDQDHARLAAVVAGRLEALGWTPVTEVTYSEYGERGSIDMLGIDVAHRACAVIEVKTAITSAEAVGRKLDEKARLAPGIVAARWGWRPASVARILVLPETMRLRRRIEAEPALRRMLPPAASAIRAWLRTPAGPLAATWFLSDSGASGVGGVPRVRIRVRTAPVSVAISPQDAGGPSGASADPSNTAASSKR